MRQKLDEELRTRHSFSVRVAESFGRRLDESMQYHAKEARSRGLRKLGHSEDTGQIVRIPVSQDMGWRTRRDANQGSSKSIDDGKG